LETQHFNTEFLEHTQRKKYHSLYAFNRKFNGKVKFVTQCTEDLKSYLFKYESKNCVNERVAVKVEGSDKNKN